MQLRKLSSKLGLRFADPTEELEYVQLRIPVADSFFGYLFLAISIILLIYGIRYFIKDFIVQGTIAFVCFGVSILICIFKRKLSRYIEHIVFIFILVLLALIITAARDLIGVNGPQQVDNTEIFFIGFSVALIQRLVGYRVLRFGYMILLQGASIALKFSLLGSPGPSLIIITIILEVITVLLSFNAEVGERCLFDAMFKARRDTLKFKQLLTEYLPNQMAIFTSDRCIPRYTNKAFKRAFRCESLNNTLSCLDKLVIDKETLIKHKNLFNSFGYACNSDSQSVKLSDFILSIPASLDVMRELGTINFMVVEEENRSESLQIVENRPNEDPGTQREAILVTVNPLCSRRLPLSTRGTQVTSPKAVTKGLKKKWLSFKEMLFPQRDFLKSGKDSLDSSKDQNKSFGEENESIGLDKAGSRSTFSETLEDGRKRVFKAKLFLLLWDEAEAIALVLDDVTKQKTISDLKMADKNKDLVIAMVSHELRTPLNGMLGLIDIIKKNLKQPGLLSYINACRNNGVLLLSLVNSILDLSQIKNNKFKLMFSKVNIEDLMKEIKSLFEYFCVLKNIYLRIEIDNDVPKTIVTDKNRLSQIIINLLGNAFKFTFKGGITIRVQLESLEPYKIKFAVSDTGIGIKQEDQNKLFKLFGRLEHEDKKINTSGVGLGLTISNTLTLLLNPTDEKGIHLASEPEIGSTFSFSIMDRSSEIQTELQQSDISLENISSTSIDEDKEATVSKKMSNYTLNCIENYSKNQQSLQNLESKLNSPKKESHSDQQGSLSLIGDDVLLLRANLNTTSKKERERDLDIIKDTEGPDKENNNYEIIKEEWKRHKQRLHKQKKADKENKKKANNDQKPWCLVVDDNPFNLMVASHIMEERGYQIKQALNGKDAIQQMTQHHENGQTFKVVLMDCQMPVMDGYEATRIIRKMMNGREIDECPILALTASDRNEDHENLCREVGMSGTVTKPLQSAELETMLKKLERASQRAKKLTV